METSNSDLLQPVESAYAGHAGGLYLIFSGTPGITFLAFHSWWRFRTVAGDLLASSTWAEDGTLYPQVVGATFRWKRSADGRDISLRSDDYLIEIFANADDDIQWCLFLTNDENKQAILSYPVEEKALTRG